MRIFGLKVTKRESEYQVDVLYKGARGRVVRNFSDTRKGTNLVELLAETVKALLLKGVLKR